MRATGYARAPAPAGGRSSPQDEHRPASLRHRPDARGDRTIRWWSDGAAWATMGQMTQPTRAAPPAAHALVVALGLLVGLPTAVRRPNSLPGFTGYHSYTEIAADTAAVAAAHPDIAQRFSIGKSYQGRELWAMKISDNVATDEASPRCCSTGTPRGRTHGRRDDAPDHALARRRVRNGHADHEHRESREIWIVFLVNPDGAEYDISGGRFHFWRKNRQPTPGSGSHVGTDLNRNFGYRWGWRWQDQHQSRGDHVPRAVGLLGARRHARCVTSSRAVSSTAAADPDGHHLPRVRAAGHVAVRLHLTNVPAGHDHRRSRGADRSSASGWRPPTGTSPNRRATCTSRPARPATSCTACIERSRTRSRCPSRTTRTMP